MKYPTLHRFATILGLAGLLACGLAAALPRSGPAQEPGGLLQALETGSPTPVAAPNPVAPIVPMVDVAPGPFTNEEGHVTISGQIVPGAVPPGGKATLQVTFDVLPGYHVYPIGVFGEKAIGSKPTLIVVTDAGGLKFGPPTTAARILEGKPFEPGAPPQLYHSGKVTWDLPIEIPAEAAPGPREITGLIGFQLCDDKSCDFPSGALFKATLAVGTAQAAPAKLSFGGTGYPKAPRTAPLQRGNPPPAGAEVPSAAPPVARATAPQESAADVPFNVTEANTVVSNSLAWILTAAFIGGFLLNLMPCVLPVIGLKLLSFAEQGGQSRGQVLALNVVYSLGLLSVFWILAALAIGLNWNWGAQFQSVWFNVLLTGMVFAMALSFLGVWEIPLPGFVGEKAGELSESSGYWGAFIKGAVSTIVATPCSGPFLGAVFGATLGMAPPAIFLLFTFIGLGMASPFLLVGAVPDLIRFLPRPGEWMETFKKVMGFLMMGSVVLLVASIDRDYTIATLTLLVGLALACWMIGRIGITAEWPETIQGWCYATGAAVIIGTLAFWQLGPNEAELPWRPFDSQAVVQLQAQGKTVLIDFTAEWCATCKWNLKTAINTKRVQELVARNQVVPVIADMTSHDDETLDFLRRLKANSIPVLAIFPAGKPGEVIVLRDAVVESQVLHWLEQAGPSRDSVALHQR